MAKITKNLSCPHCKSNLVAEIVPKRYKFLIYHCPNCSSNVVIYGNKVDVVSDKLIRMLFKSNKLKTCGNILVPDKTPKEGGGGITQDAITNLKILLETESDVNSIISKL